MLKTILHAAATRVHDGTVAISVQQTTDEYFQADISGPDFRNKFKSIKALTPSEAETNSIYQFLRHITNVLGYNIMDTNHGTLINLVSEINLLNEQLSGLQLCSRKAARMINQVHEQIKNMHQEVIKHTTNPHMTEFSYTLNNFISSLQICHDAANEASTNFKQNKVYTNLTVLPQFIA